MISFKEYLSISIIIIISNIFLIFLIKNYKKKFLNILLDNEFSKVQSFHKKPALKVGGIFIFFYIILAYVFFRDSLLLKNIFYISIPIFFFSILEDIKIKINPLTRLVILFITIFFCVNLFNLQIYSIQFYNIDKLLNSNQIFSFLFSTLCILFIVNGSNFIDGFNGLLGIHVLIIISILSFINFHLGNFDLLFICILFVICLIIFLTFNFPNSKIFLGNSGSYLVGVILSFIIIETSKQTAYHKVYPFYFAILLFYLFFEVFFSFCRKIFYEKKNPLYPDKKHLHMLLYSKIKSNPKTSIYINFYFILTLLPLFFIKNYPGFLKVYFIFLVFLYCIFYLSLKKK